MVVPQLMIETDRYSDQDSPVNEDKPMYTGRSNQTNFTFKTEMVTDD